MENLASYKQILLEISTQSIEKIHQYLEIHVIENLLGYYEVLYEENLKEEKNREIIFYFPENDFIAKDRIKTLLRSLDIKESEYQIYDTILKSKNYWEEYKKSFQPFAISHHFYLIPIWYKDEVKINLNHYIPIYIEPGMAFGTGLHPSTQLMIQWIDDYDFTNKVVLDAGCGSGILSIAVLKKNAYKVIGFDIDSNAIEATKKNLSYNDLIGWLNKKIFLYEGSWDEPNINHSYDVILANMTLPVFIKYHKMICDINTNILVISGIGIEQVEDVEKFYKHHYLIKNVLEKEGWGLVEFYRK